MVSWDNCRAELICSCSFSDHYPVSLCPHHSSVGNHYWNICFSDFFASLGQGTKSGPWCSTLPGKRRSLIHFVCPFLCLSPFALLINSTITMYSKFILVLSYSHRVVLNYAIVNWGWDFCIVTNIYELTFLINIDILLPLQILILKFLLAE